MNNDLTNEFKADEIEYLSSLTQAPENEKIENKKEYHLTDYGNAEMFGDFIRGKWIWVFEIKKFFYYSKSGLWFPDNEGQIYIEAKNCLMASQWRTMSISDEEKRSKVMKYYLSCENFSRLKPMVELLKSEQGISKSISIFDGKKSLIGLKNGVFELRSQDFKFRPYSVDDFITKSCNVDYDPKAGCPSFKEFLKTITGNNFNIECYFQKLFGYCLTGFIKEQVLNVFFGSGANGKSTLLELIKFILGDYAINVPVEVFMQKDSPGLSNDVARLRGARLAITSEVESGRKLSESLVKSLTGSDTVTARFLYSEPFEFKPEAKIIMATNHLPQIRGTDLGIWRRIRTVPFTVTITPEKQDTNLLAKLKKESSGILNWILDGCKKWQHEGLGIPEEIDKATGFYKATQDVLQAFLNDATINKGIVRTSELYKSYSTWCKQNGEYEISQIKFSAQLSERGFTKRRTTGGIIVWENLGLLTE